LEFFVLFSSASGVVGNPGQSHYGAANTFMDGLAQHRYAMGLPGVSIAWGPWEGRGMMADLGTVERRRMARGGLRPLSVSQGLRVLEGTLRMEGPQLVAMSLDLKRLARGVSTGEYVLPDLYRGLVSVDGIVPQVGSLREKIEAMSVIEREGGVLDLVRQEVAKVLGLSSGHEVNPDLSVKDLGVDSLMAVELRNRLNTLLKLKLSATVIFDYPHVRALSTLILEGFNGDQPAESGAVEIHDVWDEEALSEEELQKQAEMSQLDDDDFLRHALDLLESGGDDEP